MRGTRSIKRIGGGLMVAAALAGAGATQAQAMAVNPTTCTARLVSVVAPTGSCGFDSVTDWSSISVVTDRVITATTTCNSYGYVRTSTRTIYERATWTQSTVGTCSLTLTTGPTGANAVGVVTPTVRIYEPYPYPAE